MGPFGPYGGGFNDFDNRADDGGGMLGNDYDLYENYASNFGHANQIMPLFQGHVKTCKPEMMAAHDSCRPLYMPCKDDTSCAVACQVNDFSCGKCSEEKNYRSFCRCCFYVPPLAK